MAKLGFWELQAAGDVDSSGSSSLTFFSSGGEMLESEWEDSSEDTEDARRSRRRSLREPVEYGLLFVFRVLISSF